MSRSVNDVSLFAAAGAKSALGLLSTTLDWRMLKWHLVLALGWLLCAATVGGKAAVPVGNLPTVVSIEVEGAITGSTTDLIREGIMQAERSGATALLLELNTPGGLLDATREIVGAILDSRVPVITFVSPAGAHAGSAGTFITMASHVAAMVPTSNIGAAHPVGLFGDDVPGAMGKKVENDTAALARTVAQAHGRNVEWAEKSVLESASLTAREAQQQKVIDLIAKDRKTLLELCHGRDLEVRGQKRVLSTRGAIVKPLERTASQEVHAWLSSPSLVYVLLLLGLLGLYIEINHPGLIVPGLLGAVCLGIVFFLQILPLNMLGLTLVGCAAVLFFAEIYVPSMGLLSVAAVVCLVIGSFMLFDVPGSTVRPPPILIWGAASSFASVCVILAIAIVRVQRQGATSGVDALVGQRVDVERDIPAGGTGRVFADGTSWLARCEQHVTRGDSVRIVARDGLTLHVERASEKPADP